MFFSKQKNTKFYKSLLQIIMVVHTLCYFMRVNDDMLTGETADRMILLRCFSRFSYSVG